MLYSHEAKSFTNTPECQVKDPRRPLAGLAASGELSSQVKTEGAETVGALKSDDVSAIMNQVC